MIQKNYIGAASVLTGHFEIVGVPTAPFTLLVKYIGYEDKIIPYDQLPTEPLEIFLKSIAIQGEEVVITALARGQMGAINQQINSLQIKNVVSAARIEERQLSLDPEDGSFSTTSLILQGGETSYLSERSDEFSFTVNSMRLSGRDS